jgi:hypothetical protein
MATSRRNAGYSPKEHSQLARSYLILLERDQRDKEQMGLGAVRGRCNPECCPASLPDSLVACRLSTGVATYADDLR